MSDKAEQDEEKHWVKGKAKRTDNAQFAYMLHIDQLVIKNFEIISVKKTSIKKLKSQKSTHWFKT